MIFFLHQSALESGISILEIMMNENNYKNGLLLFPLSVSQGTHVRLTSWLIVHSPNL